MSDDKSGITRQRLQEATYNLELMYETRAARQKFRSHLHAFIVAFRSITLMMQKEFRSIEGFDEWYSEKQDFMRAEPNLVWLKNKRNLVLKQRPAKVSGVFSANITENLSLHESVAVTLNRRDGSKVTTEMEPQSPNPSPLETKAETDVLWYFDDMPEVDVITFCEKYLRVMEEMVEECESRFGSESST